jgi:multiple sugar transport system permease protein
MKSSILKNFLIGGLRILLVLVFLLPIIWMVFAALIPPGTPLPQNLWPLPTKLSLRNFSRIWELVPIGKFLLNSLRVAGIAVPITLVTSSWAGFAMSQLPRPSQNKWVILSLIILMIPGISLWSTRFILYKTIGIYNSIWALVIPSIMGTNPFFVLMFYRAFRRIPQEVYDTARLDGADVLQIWGKIALPIARPTAIGVILLSFIHYWGDFLSPLLYIRTERYYTLSIALQLLQQMGRSDWPLLMAAAVTSLIIPLVLYLILQPFFMANEKK